MPTSWRPRTSSCARQNAGLKGQIAANQAAVADAQALKDLADLPDIADYDSVFASVVDGSIGNFERTFQIDRGTDDGIAKDMAVVVGAHGGALVGKVTSASKSRATVQRIDDAQFGVGVQLVDPSGALGPARRRDRACATARSSTCRSARRRRSS